MIDALTEGKIRTSFYVDGKKTVKEEFFAKTDITLTVESLRKRLGVLYFDFLHATSNEKDGFTVFKKFVEYDLLVQEELNAHFPTACKETFQTRDIVEAVDGFEKNARLHHIASSEASVGDAGESERPFTLHTSDAKNSLAAPLTTHTCSIDGCDNNPCKILPQGGLKVRELSFITEDSHNKAVSSLSKDLNNACRVANNYRLACERRKEQNRVDARFKDLFRKKYYAFYQEIVKDLSDEMMNNSFGVE